MLDDKSAIAAKEDRDYREKFISENTAFVLSCASRASGKWVDIHDDLYSEALIAFNGAIECYSSERGSFKAFAERVIGNRVTDCLRRESASERELPFSCLSSFDDDGEEVLFDLADRGEDCDIIFEIQMLERALSGFDISFAELPEISPKTQKAKKECRRAVRYIISDKKLVFAVKKNRKLPIAELLRELDINKKMLERYRKYIIVGVLICTGGYTVLEEYFWG